MAKNPRQYQWLYSPRVPSEGKVRFSTDESRHLKALRLSEGEKVSLFDGKGKIAVCELIGEDQAKVLETIEEPKSEFTIGVAVAVPKGERADWMLQKLTELGIDVIIPLKTERSAVIPRETKQERWQKILIEACKQSKRAHLPELHNLSTINQAIDYPVSARLLLEPSGQNISKVLHDLPKSVLAFIGPEGGFTVEEEIIIKEHNAQEVSLGKNILRIETAAVAFAAVLNSMR